MAIKKKYRMNVYIDYEDTEDEDRWIGSTEFNVTKLDDDEDAAIDTFAPNFAEHTVREIITELESFINKSRSELHKYVEPTKYYDKDFR